MYPITVVCSLVILHTLFVKQTIHLYSTKSMFNRREITGGLVNTLSYCFCPRVIFMNQKLSFLEYQTDPLVSTACKKMHGKFNLSRLAT